MTLKEKIAELLVNGGDGYLSGSEMARRCEVTRAAVWKAIQALTADGYLVDSVPGLGYRLSEGSDVLSAAGIRKYLGDEAGDYALRVEQRISSTNTVLRTAAEQGAAAWTVAVAACQTDGRGRMGRSFYSPADTGLYLSILLRPTLDAQQATLITTAAAVAVCRAVEALTGREPGIKWVNDVFLDGRKVCGILTEAALSMENGKLDYAVVGMGLNVYEPAGGFPEEIRSVAGSILSSREPDLRNRLAAAVLGEFREIYGGLESRGFLAEYRQRSLVLGRRIRVLSGGGDRQARALDMDDLCRLTVEYDDGSRETLSSGEISIRMEQ